MNTCTNLLTNFKITAMAKGNFFPNNSNSLDIIGHTTITANQHSNQKPGLFLMPTLINGAASSYGTTDEHMETFRQSLSIKGGQLKHVRDTSQQAPVPPRTHRRKSSSLLTAKSRPRRHKNSACRLCVQR